ncbi:5-hydroxytryptamine receptor 1B-like [Paramacrobiotus metropolitanus]|uniref:5-hydroxytryptamine receptor 1B-like n=1 Tax=Paramacrobiotus metropolitanus TaxID=2943436 RepID=UPI0024460B53|nr:5-hydroxytryptamine receptor 1B-like [Paramacrobiotus metropolitanus]
MHFMPSVWISLNAFAGLSATLSTVNGVHTSIMQLNNTVNAKESEATQLICVAYIAAPALIFEVIYAVIIVYVLLSAKRLRTPFCMYLVNILLSGIANSMLRCAVQWHIIATGFASDQSAFSVFWCAAEIFSDWIVGPLSVTAHIPFAVSRAWAVTFPLSYRKLHSKKIAVATCLLMHIFTCLIRLPHFVWSVQKLRVGDGPQGVIPAHIHHVMFVCIKALWFASFIIVFGSLPYVSVMRRIKRTRMPVGRIVQQQLSAGANRIYMISTIICFVIWMPIIVANEFFPLEKVLIESIMLFGGLGRMLQATLFALYSPLSREAFYSKLRNIVPWFAT